MRRLVGYNLLLCGLLCLVTLVGGMKERMAAIRPADRVPFWIGTFLGLGIFLVPAYLLLRSPRVTEGSDESEWVDDRDPAPDDDCQSTIPGLPIRPTLSLRSDPPP